MPPKKTIADEIKKSFSRYFTDQNSENFFYKIVWTPQSPSRNQDDDVIKIEDDDSLNESTKKADTANDRLRTNSIVEPQTDEIQLSVDRRKEDDNITGFDVEVGNPNLQEKVEHDLTDGLLIVVDGIGKSSEQEPVNSNGDLCNGKNEPIENLLRDFVSFEYSTDKVQQGNQQIGSKVEKSDIIGDIEKASTVSDELNEYIKFYDKRSQEYTSAVDKELEFIVGTQQVQSIVKASEHDFQKPLIIAASDAVDSTGTSQDRSDLSGTFNTVCTVDSMYETIQDKVDPTLFTIRLKTDLPVKSGKFTEQTDPSAILCEKHQIRPCFVELTDCLVRRRKLRRIARKVLYVDQSVIVFDTEPTPKQPTKQQKAPKPPATDKPKKSAKVKADANAKKPTEKAGAKKKQKKREIAVKPTAASNKTQKAAAKKKKKAVEAPTAPTYPLQERLDDGLGLTKPTENTTIVIEEKIVSINEWLQEASQVQPDNNVDVNEFFQDVNFPVLSDIVSIMSPQQFCVHKGRPIFKNVFY